MGKYLVQINPPIFIGYELTDDDDVTCMIDAFLQTTELTTLGIYVEIDVVGSSILPVQSLCSNFEVQQYDLPDESFSDDEEWNSELEFVSDEDEDGDEFTYYDSADSTDSEDEGECGSNIIPSRLVSPVSSVRPEGGVFQQPGQSHGAFINPSPHYRYIDWNHLDEDTNFAGLDIPGSWQVG